MTRAEYEKFRNVARTGAMGEDYAFREYASQHPRVWLNREGRPGAWIDIFIFDSISGVPWMRKLKLLGCAFFLAFTKNREFAQGEPAPRRKALSAERGLCDGPAVFRAV